MNKVPRVAPDRVTTAENGHVVSVRLFVYGATARLDCPLGCTPQVRHATVEDVHHAEEALLRRACTKGGEPDGAA